MSKVMTPQTPRELERNFILHTRKRVLGRADWTQAGLGWLGKVEKMGWIFVGPMGWAGERSLEQGFKFPYSGRRGGACTSFPPRCGATGEREVKT